MKKTLLFIGLALFFDRCERIDTPRGTPDCIEDKIREIASEEVWNPPAKIYSYWYNGQTVYFIPQRCCDIPSVLMDSNCNAVCFPDGGIGGSGDGECPDFFDTRTNEKLIWEDTREYSR
jgi:hypothetical protein